MEATKFGIGGEWPAGQACGNGGGSGHVAFCTRPPRKADDLQQRLYASRQFSGFSRNQYRLQPRRLAAHHAERSLRYAQRLRQQADHRGIGLALVGHGGDAKAQHGAAIITDLDALYRIAPRIGRHPDVKGDTSRQLPQE